MDTILLCLALTVFQEARGEPVEGQRAVATVVLNRAKIRGMSECEVVLEKGQFSWKPDTYMVVTRKGKGKEYRMLKSKIPVRAKGWQASLDAARYALTHADTLQNAEFFHSIHVKPHWNKRFVKVFRIGNHVFYARNPDFQRKKLAKFEATDGSFKVKKA